MGPSQKLDVAHVQVGLIVDAVFGTLVHSRVVSAATLVVLITRALHDGDVRFSGRGR